MKLICIDDRNRPNEIPESKWVKKGELYTMVRHIKCNSQGGRLAIVLEEIDLTGCDPYKGFALERFAPIVSDKVKEEVEELEMI